MQKLHLVGFTTDHEGLVLSARRGARSGGYTLIVDETIETALEELRELRAEAQAEAEAEAKPSRVESALSVKEIQARLRQGRSVAEVARVAGVDTDWVERFAAPVLAERAQVISRVRSTPLRRPRLGPSQLPIGEAIRQQLADRGVSFTSDEFASAWTARQVADGRWSVRFKFHYRAKDQTLRYDLNESRNEVVAADRTSSQLGYVAPTPEKAKPAKSSEGDGSGAKRAVVTTGFRPDPQPARPTSAAAKERERAAVAMRRAAAQRAAEAEKAAARRAREKREQAQRLEREARAAEAAEARAARAAEQAAKAKQRDAAAKRRARAAEQASKAKKSPVPKKRASKRDAAPKAATKKASPIKAEKRTPLKAAPASEPRTPSRSSLSPGPSAAPARPAPVSVPGRADPLAPARGPASRPVFRPGLVERVSGEVAAASERRSSSDGAGANGAEAAPRPASGGRPRRTRPLRAT